MALLLFSTPGPSCWKGRNALSLAVEYGQKQVSKLLLDNGADVNSKCQRKRTPLHNAVERDDLTLAKLLLYRGAEVNANDDGGWSPLAIAIENGSKEMVSFLIGHGSDMEHIFGNSMNRSPYGYKTGICTVKMYDDEGDKVYFRFECEVETSRRHVTNDFLYEVWDAQHFAGKTFNKYDRVDLFTLMDFFHTPLSWAVGKANEAIVRVLLEAGVDVNAKGKAGRTALYCAAGKGNTAMALFLLENGADVNLEDDFGLTSLQIAAKEGHVETTRLIEKRANLEMKSECGRTALEHVINCNKGAIVNILRKKLGVQLD